MNWMKSLAVSVLADDADEELLAAEAADPRVDTRELMALIMKFLSAEV
jgi:hypothetical protein